MAHFSFLVLASTGLAESASSTTPVLKLLLERALCFPKAKEMEWFTAHLAEDKLKGTGAGIGREKQRLEYREIYIYIVVVVKKDNQNVFTSTFPLLAHKKQSSLGVTGTEVSRLRPPASHTFSTSWSLLKSTLMRCTPSQGTLDIIWPLVEGVLRQFKVLLLGGLVVSGFSCSLDKKRVKVEGEYVEINMDLRANCLRLPCLLVFALEMEEQSGGVAF